MRTAISHSIAMLQKLAGVLANGSQQTAPPFSARIMRATHLRQMPSLL
jgi:hypothetical protein